MTDASLGSNASQPVLDPATALHGTLFYDAGQVNAQRVNHAPGSYECVAFYNTTGPCTLIMNNVGLYRLVSPGSSPRSSPRLSPRSSPRSSPGVVAAAATGPDDVEQCCLDMPGIVNVPRDWAAQAAGREFVGVEVEAVSGRSCRHWRWPAGAAFHHYYEDAAGGLPVRWTFPAAEGRQDWYFKMDSFGIGAQDQSMFELPAGCAATNCSSSSGGTPTAVVEDRTI